MGIMLSNGVVNSLVFRHGCLDQYPVVDNGRRGFKPSVAVGGKCYQNTAAIIGVFLASNQTIAPFSDTIQPMPCQREILIIREIPGVG